MTSRQKMFVKRHRNNITYLLFWVNCIVLVVAGFSNFALTNALGVFDVLSMICVVITYLEGVIILHDAVRAYMDYKAPRISRHMIMTKNESVFDVMMIQLAPWYVLVFPLIVYRSRVLGLHRL
jgi:hypothetical protein